MSFTPQSQLDPPSEPPSPSRRRPWEHALLIAALVGVTLIAFSPGLNNQFLNWDDDRNFLENQHYRGLGIEQLRWARNTYHLGVWQPLSWLLLGVQYEIGGIDPRVYHAASLALHCLNAVVFYWLVVVLLRAAAVRTGIALPRGLNVCAAGIAAIFAVHPLRVEVVNWVSCQPYLPAALFSMLGVLAYLRRSAAGVSVRDASRHSSIWLAVAFAFYVLAVMSKAVAVSLPAVLLILDVYPLRRLGGRAGWFSRQGALALIEKLPFLAVAAAVSIWAAEAKDYSETRVPFAQFDADARLAQSAHGLAFYLGKTIVPVNLIAYYRLPDDLSLLTWRYGLYALGVIALTAALIARRKQWPGLLAAWAAYVVVLLPNLGIVQISRQIAADRYSYLAIMPGMVLAAAGMLGVLQRTTERAGGSVPTRIGACVAIVGVVLVLMGASRRQVSAWRDSETLWQSVLEVDPRCAVAECNLGAAHLVVGRFAEASEHLSRAIDLQSDFAFAYANLGTVFAVADRHEDAALCFWQALDLGPDLAARDLAKVHAGLGLAYAALRKDDLAWKHTRKAQQLGFKDAEKMIDYLRRFSKEPTD